MTDLLLFLILVVQGVSLFLQAKQAKLNDLTKEDESVKLATADIKKAKKNVDAAKQRIPSEK